MSVQTNTFLEIITESEEAYWDFVYMMTGVNLDPSTPDPLSEIWTMR